ncbi:MAG: septum site-determining protein MinC, partial [Planctomycetota bacterium]
MVVRLAFASVLVTGLLLGAVACGSTPPADSPDAPLPLVPPSHPAVAANPGATPGAPVPAVPAPAPA